jgi:hypothetical protein
MRFKQVRKRTIAVAALAALVIVVLSAFTINLLLFPTKYQIHINRDVKGQTEEDVLAAAESINYTDVTKLERFDGSTDPDDYLHPKTYLAYTFANYVDAEVLSYYQNRYDSLKGKGEPHSIEYTYDANVSEYQTFRIYNSPPPVGVDWYNTTVVLAGSNSDGSYVSKCSVMQIYLRNQTGYTLTEWDYDYNFTDCYVVRMALGYNEFYSPTAAFYATVNQIVVLDRDYRPLLIGISARADVA